ncbi:hypothetical protein E4U43_002241 [Claviceps pusilla]|uniref:L-dopachrome isomerase n=1 Tax=Claviceps pusilla TaxID=123648 RepID=A0A9P7T2A6_9HYPO|nr:hypothetical protein E4U43_002241 [Claviceps pusilla]
MADNYYFPPRRSPSPAEALFFSNHAFNDTSRRTPSPQVSFSDKRNSQHVRRSSLEPVFEGEIKTTDSQRRSVNHGVSSTQPKPNLAKPRVPISARSSHRVASSSSLRNSQALDESILSAEVKTNVVITNEYLFMNELSYHLALRYGRPLSSIVVSLQHGICLHYGGSFDPAYILTITGRQDQVMDKRNVMAFQEHLHQAIRVAPARGLVQFIFTAEDSASHGIGATACGTPPAVAAARPSSTVGFNGPESRRVKSPSTAKIVLGSAGANRADKSTDQMIEDGRVQSTKTGQRASDESSGSLYAQGRMMKRRGFIYSLFTRS